MIGITVEFVSLLTLGVLVVAMLGLFAALVSKAARDLREDWALRRYRDYVEVLQHPESVPDRYLMAWRRYAGLRRDALLRAMETVEQERGRPLGPRLRRVDDLADGLVSQMGSRSAPRRGMALLLLGHLGRPQDCPVMTAGAADPDGDVRLCAIRALDQLASKESFDALVGLLCVRQGYPQTPLAQARIVERLARPWARSWLVPALTDLVPGRGDTRAIGLLRAMEIAEPTVPGDLLEPWIRDGTLDERVAAVRAHRACVGALSATLLAAVRDEAPAVRGQAVRALNGIRVSLVHLSDVIDALVVAMSDTDWWVRGYAAAALVSLGEPGVFALRRVARGADDFAAHRAQEQLALIGGSRS